jgi:hypothetical protein
MIKKPTSERYCLGLACQSIIGYSVKDSADCTHYHHKECNFCRGCAETSFTPKWDASGRKRKQCRLWNLSRILNEQLQNPLVQNNSRLRLWCLIAKGYTDIEIDYRTAKLDWLEEQAIAKNLGESRRVTRAFGELCLIVVAAQLLPQ